MKIYFIIIACLLVRKCEVMKVRICIIVKTNDNLYSLKFLQRMSDKELHRRLITGTINTCSVTSKTVTMLSTNAQQSITQAKVSISKIILVVIYEQVDCNLH